MKTRFVVHSLIAAALGCARQAASAPAVPESDRPVTLAPVEVTGSLIRRAEDEGPSPVQIITREDIEFSGRVSFSEFMAELPTAGVSGINEAVADGALRGASA